VLRPTGLHCFVHQRLQPVNTAGGLRGCADALLPGQWALRQKQGFDVDNGRSTPAQAAMSEGVSNISFSELSGNLGSAMYQYSFRIPAYYTLLVGFYFAPGF